MCLGEREKSHCLVLTLHLKKFNLIDAASKLIKKIIHRFRKELKSVLESDCSLVYYTTCCYERKCMPT